jgi:PhnB protein
VGVVAQSAATTAGASNGAVRSAAPAMTAQPITAALWQVSRMIAVPFPSKPRTGGTARDWRLGSARSLFVGSKEPLMSSRLNPYITFNGNARQALEFYKGVFGGALALNTFGEMGGPGGPEADNIMHGMLETDSGYTLMGADNPPGMEFQPGNNMAVSLSGDDRDQLLGYWVELSSGGTVTVPLEKQMWGDEFGMCTDRFGVAWMVNISQPQT